MSIDTTIRLCMFYFRVGLKLNLNYKSYIYNISYKLMLLLNKYL